MQEGGLDLGVTFETRPRVEIDFSLLPCAVDTLFAEGAERERTIKQIRCPPDTNGLKEDIREITRGLKKPQDIPRRGPLRRIDRIRALTRLCFPPIDQEGELRIVGAIQSFLQASEIDPRSSKVQLYPLVSQLRRQLEHFSLIRKMATEAGIRPEIETVSGERGDYRVVRGFGRNKYGPRWVVEVTERHEGEKPFPQQALMAMSEPDLDDLSSLGEESFENQIEALQKAGQYGINHGLWSEERALIPQIYERGEIHGRRFAIMDLPPATSLYHSLMTEGKFEEGKAITVASQLCKVLEAVHQGAERTCAGIPEEEIFWDYNGEKVIVAGIQPLYPYDEIGVEDDTTKVAKYLYRMAVGIQAPIGGRPLSQPKECWEGITLPLQEILKKALHPNPTERYQNPEALRTQLELLTRSAKIEAGRTEQTLQAQEAHLEDSVRLFDAVDYQAALEELASVDLDSSPLDLCLRVKRWECLVKTAQEMVQKYARPDRLALKEALSLLNEGQYAKAKGKLTEVAQGKEYENLAPLLAECEIRELTLQISRNEERKDFPTALAALERIMTLTHDHPYEELLARELGSIHNWKTALALRNEREERGREDSFLLESRSTKLFSDRPGTNPEVVFLYIIHPPEVAKEIAEKVKSADFVFVESSTNTEDDQIGTLTFIRSLLRYREDPNIQDLLKQMFQIASKSRNFAERFVAEMIRMRKRLDFIDTAEGTRIDEIINQFWESIIHGEIEQAFLRYPEFINQLATMNKTREDAVIRQLQERFSLLSSCEGIKRIAVIQGAVHTPVFHHFKRKGGLPPNWSSHYAFFPELPFILYSPSNILTRRKTFFPEKEIPEEDYWRAFTYDFLIKTGLLYLYPDEEKAPFSELVKHGKKLAGLSMEELRVAISLFGERQKAFIKEKGSPSQEDLETAAGVNAASIIQNLERRHNIGLTI